ncbi:MAG: serine/threonine protein kinase [Proteobacteria bacterium]|nr:serine/threonine protein kinase [Pseudomonadota bacterium]
MSPSIVTGTVLRARYRITQLLHQSRHAEIYLVEDQHLRDRVWAVRVMPVYSVDPYERNRVMGDFLTEAQRLSQIEHPSLAKVVDYFAEGNNLYIVREFVHGTDLDQLLSTRVMPLTEREAIAAVLQIVDAVSYLLGRKVPAIFFRELTAKNIIICKNGQVKLLDLGLARAFSSQDSEALMRMGSLDYASPEQFSESGTFDQRSLVYSTGAILYHMLTRRNPALSPFALDPIEEVNPNISGAVEDLVHRATENDPRDRHASLAELKKHLQSASRAPKESPKTRASRGLARDGWQVRTPTEDEEESFDGSIWHWILVAVLVSLMSGALLAIYYYFFRP